MKRSLKIKQRDVSDCGPSCLASIAAYYDLRLPVARIRQITHTDKKGTSILGLINGAEHLGFQAKGVRGGFDSLFKIPRPAIAHLIIKEVLHHYVVIYNATHKYIEVMDPSDGHLHRYDHESFKKVWSGALILLLPGEKLETADTLETVLGRFWKIVHPYRFVIIQALFGALIYTIIGLSTSIFIQKIIDHVLVDGNRNLLNLMSLSMVALLFLAIFIGYMKSLFTLQTGQVIDSWLILGYYKHLLMLPQPFFDSMRVGEVLSRINDATKIRAFINDAAINLAVNCFVILLSFALMFTYYWKLAAVILLVIPLYSLVYFITNKLNKKVERRLMENAAELESQLVESVNAIGTLKSFGLEPHAKLKTEDRFFKLLQTVYQSGLNNLSSGFTVEFISRLLVIILLWIGAGFVLDNQITPGELLSFYALIGYFTNPAASLIGMNKLYQNAMIAADRLFEIMDLEHENNENKINLTPEMIGDIQFKDVGFTYGTRVTVFKGFNLTIARGTVVALVGESGSGKSTLIHMLQNLYPIHSGTIHVGDYNLKHLENNSLRRWVGVVPQRIDLFAGSVIDNIAIGDDQPDMKKIIATCSSLGMLEFIEHLPAGFNTYLGENGATLSGGQKQRLAIARALYRDPEILILDEATASLDSVAEQYVQKAIEVLREKGTTVIIISHRFSTVFHADKIVVLSNGKVAEEGRHETLLRNKGLYYRMWRSQFPVEEMGV